MKKNILKILGFIGVSAICGFSTMAILNNSNNYEESNASTIYQVENFGTPYVKSYYEELQLRLTDMPSGVNTRTWKFGLSGYLTEYPTQSELTELIVQQQKSNDINYLTISYRFNYNTTVNGSAGVWNGDPSIAYVTNTVVYLESYTPTVIISTDGVMCPFTFEELINIGNYDTSFTFNKMFNYNAFIQYKYCVEKTTDVSPSLRSVMPYYTTQYVYNSTDFPNVQQTYKYSFNSGFFSNGRYYSDIVAIYAFIASPDKFQDKNNQLISADNTNLNGNVTFLKMYYVNEDLGYNDEVCGREYGYYDNLGSYYPYEPTWSNNAFQTIEFFGGLQNTDINYIFKMVNNLNVYDGFNNQNQNQDLNLAYMFTLFTSAIESLLPILSIQLLPNITIGLLLFMPLVAGIIIFIIWIVKR